jgi:uncharacterized RDD family membrane protein YckC
MERNFVGVGDESKMSCPQCQSAEIGSSGKCKVCGYQILSPDSVSEMEPEAKDTRKHAGMIEMNYSEGDQESPPKEEIPQWRKDLAQRLQAIKQKKEVAGAAGNKAPIDYKPSPSSDFQIKTVAVPVPPPAKPDEKTPARKPAPKLSAPLPRQKTLQPLAPETVASKPAGQQADPREIQKLIDSVVSRQSPVADKPAGHAENNDATHERMVDDEGKWILLSRTLSGLIDLICIVLCAGIFVLAADFISGIIVVDSTSLMNLSALLLLTYFVYSLFFLVTSNQTIGMMITDLRVVGMDEKRPPVTRLAIRCCCYIISLLAFGIGLLWALFNRRHLCLHDRLSDTMVVRI